MINWIKYFKGISFKSVEGFCRVHMLRESFLYFVHRRAVFRLSHHLSGDRLHLAMDRLSQHLSADGFHMTFENRRHTGNFIAFISWISLDLQVMSIVGLEFFSSITMFRIDGKSVLRVLYSSRGGLPYETDGDALRKFWIQPLKETNLGVAQAFCVP